MGEGLHAMIPTYVVIPARNRHVLLKDCIESIADDDCLEEIIVVDNLSDPPMIPNFLHPKYNKIYVMGCGDDPPNISRLWNMGIDTARSWAMQRMQSEFNIAVLNSDVMCPDNWLSGMGNGLRKYNATLAYPEQYGSISAPVKHVVAGPISLYERITGYAFMLRGETSIRLNEDLKWWYGDDDLDWRCRELGGSVLLPNLAVKHMEPNVSTNARPELAAQTALDRETFLKIWGKTPW